VVGSRTYPAIEEAYGLMSIADQETTRNLGRKHVKGVLDNINGPSDAITIVSGAARGVDSWAAEFGRARGWNIVEIRPNWKKFGNGAGFKRNTEIIQAADDVIAFWDCSSRGTLDSIRKAFRLKKPLMVFGPTGELLLGVTDEDYIDPTSSTKAFYNAIKRGIL